MKDPVKMIVVQAYPHSLNRDMLGVWAVVDWRQGKQSLTSGNLRKVARKTGRIARYAKGYSEKMTR